MSIKAILLDIDGTLTNSEKIITPKTKEALLKAQSKGIKLAIVSARTENGLARFGRWLDFEHNHGIHIACNGADIKDAETGEVIYQKTIKSSVVKDLLNHLKNYKVTVLITNGEYMYTNDVFSCNLNLERDGKKFNMNVVEYESRSNEYLLCEKRDLAEFVDFPVSKILIAADPEYLKEVHEEMAKPFMDTTSNGFTAPFYYEFNPKGVDKASAIEIAFKSLGIEKDEMMAFGDAQNDIPMIKAVKYGIAMGNAIDDLKNVAFDTTLDNDHDGIAEAIYKYMPELQD